MDANYEEALRYLELAQQVMPDSEEPMGAYIYLNKTGHIESWIGWMRHYKHTKWRWSSMMPVMDGLTAAKTIRALDRPDAKTIPIIAMTANAYLEDAKDCMSAGMNAHLGKPLDIDLAVQTIADFCGST